MKVEFGEGSSTFPAEHANNEKPSPWDVTLKRSIGSIDKGNWYRVVMTVQAEKNRHAIFAICQSEEPWDPLGYFENLPLSTTKRILMMDFHATLSDASPEFVVALGGESPAVEIGNLDVQMIHESAVWQWSLDPACQAKRFQGKDPGTMLIDEIETDGNPWHVQLIGLPREVHEGEIYRWECRLSSPEERKVAFGLRQSVDPYEAIGLWRKETIGPTEQEIPDRI